MNLLTGQLIKACRFQNFTRATELLQQGAYPNEWNDERTLLFYGCLHGRLEFVKLLVEKYECNPGVRDGDEWTPLHTACEYGRLNIVQYLISERGCNPEVRDKNQRTPLYYAYINKNMEIVQILIRHQNVNVYHKFNNDEQTIIHCACQNGQLNIVQYLISERCCNPEVRDSDQQTPLHYACQYGHLNIVQYLIRERGCNPEVRDSDQQTPLHYVCHNGHLNIVQCLISEGGCNPEVRDNDQQTPLHYVCHYGYLNIVQYLISEGGCNPEVRDSDQQTPLHYVCHYGYLNIVQYLISEGGCNPEVRDSDQQTPLHYVCHYGHLNIVQYLISEGGCNPEVRDRYQQTPLHLAYRTEHIEIVQFLIRQQNINVHQIMSNSYQQTLLHFTSRDGYLNIVQYLISERGCNPEVKDRYQHTPLYLANLNKHTEIVQFLIRQQNVNVYQIMNSDQQTLLHCTCQDGHLNIVQYLISEQGCNPELRDRYQKTPLHYACQYGHLNIVQYLISKQGCNPEVRSMDQQTSLHYACQNGHFNIVRYLIREQGCNVDVQDNSGNTPLHYAIQNVCDNLITFLLNEGKCNPDLTNNDGNTALHIACMRHSIVDLIFVKYLLIEGNSNPNIKNKNEQTPLELTSDTEVIIELIRHGAKPTNVYETHGKVVGTKQPLQPPVKVFVVGNPSAGKSTLTAALKKEKSRLARTFTPAKRVSGVDEKTAGVIPHDFVSKKSGPITLYDFAGQPEFYSSHAALLQNAIQTSPPIFLLVVNLCESNEEMKQTILYWLSFLENQCTSVSSKSNVIIVGSHIDVLKARGEDPKQKSSVINSLYKSHQFSNLDLSGLVILDCQYSESTGMSELRECLKKSCYSLRNQETININAHCFFVYLLDKFRGTAAIKINDIIPYIHRGKESANESDPLFFLPDSTSALCSLCDELNDRGHILLLKDPVSIENSWVIIDKAILLSEVTGTIFAPETFKQHCKLASSTGVVPVSNLAKTFPKHNLEMLVGFLSHLEFCHEITDQEVLQLASEQCQTTSEEAIYSPSDRYLLFPALIRLNAPCTGSSDASELEVWKQYSELHHFGWILKCSHSGQFFTSRFLQVLLLRLAFTFAFPHKQHSASEKQVFPSLLRKCSIWRNGIYWGNRDGVETLVEVVEKNKAVIVLMRCLELTSEYLQLRSSVIKKVLAAASMFCGKVDTKESFIDPSEIIKYPLIPTTQLTLFSLAEIAEVVCDAKPAVLSVKGRTLSVDRLLVFEPYALTGSKILHQLFSTEHSTTTVTDRFFSQIADRIPEKKDILVKLFNPSPTLLAEKLSRTLLGDSFVVICVLQIWRDGCEGTYQCLREKLDRWSVFAGRNPLELAGVSTHTVHHGNDDQFTEDETQTHPGLLSLIDLGTLQTTIWDARVKWYNLGVDLDIPVSTLDVIERNNPRDVDSCFTAMLKEWLKTNPTWSSLVEALKSPPVDYPQLAEEVFTNYVNTTSTTSTPGN